MAVAHTRTFKEYYNALIARVPTEEEQIKNVYRAETSARKAIELKETLVFKDVLHVAGIMIADKKRADKGERPEGVRDFEMPAYNLSRRVWFPKMVPRQIPPRTRPGPVGYPYAASRAIKAEEEDIRNWIVAVEAKLRENIYNACHEVLLIMKQIDMMKSNEERGRNRIMLEENDEFRGIRRKLFLSAPPDYFRAKVIERYGVTKTIEPRELTVEERETAAREKIQADEVEDYKKTWGYLDFVYGAYFYMLHHGEIVGRMDAEQKEKDARYEVIAQSCRKTSGLTFYHTPALSLHCSDAVPTLRALSQKEIEMRAREEKPAVYLAAKRMTAADC